jgi:tagatose 6-phosphate kinase
MEIITLSGSLPKGLPTDFYGKMITIAKKKKKKVLLDTSGNAFSQAVKAGPFMIKPNRDEIKAIYEGPTESIEDLVQAIRYFKSLGIQYPMISLGKEGSLAGLDDGVYKASFPNIDVVNAVGSGDSFIAGCAVGLSRKMQANDLLKFATACGSANTQYNQTGFVEQSKVDEYFKLVNVLKIADY